MNGVLLDLGFIQIYWYSICIVLGMIVGMCLVYREASKRGISENEMTDIIITTDDGVDILCRQVAGAMKRDFIQKPTDWEDGSQVSQKIIFPELDFRLPLF